MRINGGAGAINATVNGAATTGTGSAVVITGTGPATFANTGTITTTGAASSGISISGVTTAAVTCGTVSTTGANSPAVVIAANGTTNVTCGTVSTTGADSNAIVVSNTAGTTTVTAGTTTTTGANSRGIVVSSTGGDVTVTAATTTTSGANASGVTATATNAKVRVIANNVSVSGLNSSAVRASAQSEAFVSVGNALATQANTVEVTSAIGQAVVRIFGTTEARLGGSALVARGATVDIEVLPTGSLLSATGDALVATSSGGGIAIRNTGLISSTGGNSVNADGGPVTLTNSGMLNGRILFGTSADTLNNTGIFNASGTSNFGAGTDALNNDANGRILTSGSATFSNLETLTNAGTISLIGNGVASRLTTSGNYVGAGGQLLVDVDGTTADRLIIGGSATGTTTIDVNRLGTTTFGTSTLVVDAGAGSSAGAFSLAASDRQVGFLTNGIVFDAANNDFRPNSVVGTGVSRSLKLGEAQTNLWYQSANAWTSHMSSRRDTTRTGETGPDIWMVFQGAVDDRDESRTAMTNGISQTFVDDYKQDYFGGQAGAGFGSGGATFGVTGGYLSSHLSFAGIAEGAQMGANNVGAYAGFNTGILFINALAKYDFYNVDVMSGALGYRTDLNGNAYGGEVEIGARLGSDRFFIEPLASIAYVRSDLDRISAFSQSIDFDKFDSVRGTAGARIGGFTQMSNGNGITYYLDGRAVHEFEGDDGLLFTAGGNNVRFENDANGTYGSARGGVQVAMPGGVAGFIEGTGNYGGDDFNSYGGRARLSIKF